MKLHTPFILNFFASITDYLDIYSMKPTQYFLSFFVMVALATHVNAQSAYYAGSLTDLNLHFFFEIQKDNAGNYSGNWSSLTQHAFNLKLKKVDIKDDSVTLETTGANAIFRGKLVKENITGEWSERGQSYPLTLKHLARPQTPQAPFPYKIDSVEYDNASKTVHLGATLSIPKTNTNPSAIPGTNTKYPVAILISGSGQQDRDETFFGHKPFAVIADYLTRKGIAVLRVDDRGTGLSKGDLQKVTTSDFADDVLTSIHYLTTRKDIDTTNIGLIGHSEGGLIAPIVYTRWPKLKFIVLLAGPGVPGSTILLRQQTDPVLSMLGKPAYDAYYPLVKEKLRILNDNYGQPDSITLGKLKAAFIKWKATLPDSISTKLNAKSATPEMYAYQETAELKPWVRYFVKTDPITYLSQVKCPVLALNGAKDTQVDPNENIPPIKAALASNNPNSQTMIIPELNHMFQHCQTGQLPEYVTIDETFASDILSLLSDWTTKIVTLHK